MPRVKSGFTRHRRHKKVLTMNKGYRGANSRLYKHAHEAMMHAGQYAYVGRKRRKRDMRQLWITRINAGIKQVSDTLNYSQFIRMMKQKQVMIDRKILAHLAATDFETFSQIVKEVGA